MRIPYIKTPADNLIHLLERIEQFVDKQEEQILKVTAFTSPNSISLFMSAVSLQTLIKMI